MSKGDVVAYTVSVYKDAFYNDVETGYMLFYKHEQQVIFKLFGEQSQMTFLRNVI